MNHLQWVEHMKSQFKKYYLNMDLVFIFGQSIVRKAFYILSKPNEEITENELQFLCKIELSLSNIA